jgi:hypothetical protein
MIVTALYDIYNNPDKLQYYVDLFKDIANSGLSIIVFTDPSLEHLFADIPENVIVYAESLRYFVLYSVAMSYTGELPATRNHSKDTQEFLALMNTKVEFMRKAFSIVNCEDDTYIWIDFGILKIITDRDAFITKLRIANAHKFDKITIPGCWNYGHAVDYDNVNWRFCGGVIIIPYSKLISFYEKSCRCLLKVCNTPDRKLTWETNIWHLLEIEGERDNIDWYFADHNDSILRDFSQ